MFNLAKPSGIFPAGKYPMYFPDAIERIGVQYPALRQIFTGDKFGNFGTYSFHWTATVTSDNKNYRITIGNNSCNFSTYAETGSSNNVRCVANYYADLQRISAGFAAVCIGCLRGKSLPQR